MIGTTAGGASEIITHGKNGYLIHPGDSTTLAGLLETLHKDRKLLQTLGMNALQSYREHPTWEETGRMIRTFLLELISRNGDGH